MAHIKRSVIVLMYIIIDIMAISAAIFLACYMRPSTLSFEITPYNVFLSPENPYRLVFSLWLVVTLFSVFSKSLYKTRREVLETFELGELIRAVIFSGIAVIVIIYSLRFEFFPRSIIGVGIVLIFCFLAIWRVFKRSFVGYLVANGYNNFNVLIIGKGKVGMALLEEIKSRKSFGFNVVGFLDDFKENEEEVTGSDRILGKLDNFRNVARREFVDQIFITVHNSDKFVNLVREATKQGVAVKVIPQGFQLISGDCFRYNIGIIPVLEYCQGSPLVRQVGKRIFDLLLVTPAILVLLPFYLALAIIIRFDSKGFPLYLSKRYGKNGRKFNMFKFRSMYIDADQRLKDLQTLNEVDGPIFKMKNDPRITNAGKWLRKYSFDELPQLLNVFIGNMSLVGPRPLPIAQVRKEDFRQLRRLDVRPGITGLWQIRGRSDISFARLVKWDMWYIKNWSLWLDLNILFNTIPVVVKGKGAY